MNPARFRWGILFILAGLLIILHNFRYIDWWVWQNIIALWPLLLIAIGVEKIFAHTKAQIISYLSPLALAGIILFVALSGSVDGDFHRVGSTYRYNLEMEPAYKSLTVDFVMDDADLTIRGTSTDNLVRCRFGSDNPNPGTEFEESDGDVRLRFDEKGGAGNWFHIDRHRRYGNRWSASVTDALPVVLNCSGDNADMRIDGRDINLNELRVESDDGDISISIGELSKTVKVILEGGGADYTVLVPGNAGIKVTGADEPIYRRFQKIGLVAHSDGYITEGYDTLSPKIELDMSEDISRFSLDFY